MPEYTHRPPLDPDTPMWRHLSLDAAVATLRERKLRFTRVDKFKDPFEGSVPQKQIDGQVAIFGSTNLMQMVAVSAHYPGMAPPLPIESEDGWTRMTRLRRAMTRSAHASCWSHGDESELLWRLYCHDKGVEPGVGVALRTTFSLLDRSVEAHDLYVSPITYRWYHVGNGFTDDIDAFMHKRWGFRAEQEVRLLRFDRAHYSAIIQKPPTAPDLPEHLSYDWAVGTIEEIVISPYADEAYEASVRAEIAEADPTMASRVILSELHPRRYAPGF